jgi:hypothetical protein
MGQSHDEREGLVKGKFGRDGLAGFVGKSEMNGVALFDHTALGQAAASDEGGYPRICHGDCRDRPMMLSSTVALYIIGYNLK